MQKIQIEQKKVKYNCKKLSRQIAVVGITLVTLISIIITTFYSYNKIINARLFTASSVAIEETYAEVAQIVDSTTLARWNYLEQIGEYLNILNDSDGENIPEILSDRIEELKANYGFTEFYMISKSGNYITTSGETGYIDFGDDLFSLVNNNENILTDGSLPERENMFFYAVNVESGIYMDFNYTAVAFGYDKEDLADILKIKAYNGTSDAYLIRSNGRVGVTMGEVSVEVRNFISLLEDCGLGDDKVAGISEDLKSKEKDTVIINIDNIDYYFSYQSIGLDDWILASLTPVAEADKAMNNVKLSTIRIFIVISAFFIIATIVVLGHWSRGAVKDSKTLLKERELIFDMMSRNMDEIFMLYNETERRMMYISPNIERLLGISVDEIYNKDNLINDCCVKNGAWDDRRYLDNIKPGDTLYREYDMLNLKTKEEHPYTLELYRPVGKESNLLVLVMSDRTREQKIRQDITSAMESARTANEAKSVFLSNMSHDIRTPMNAIMGFTSLIESNSDDKEKILDYTKKIRSSGEHLLGLINKVLDMSKIEAGKTTLEQKIVNINDVADEITDLIKPLAKAKNQTLVLYKNLFKDINVMADKLRLKQVLQNILSNAVKYTQEGGRIDFEVKLVEQDVKTDFAQYYFTVKDNGIGIENEYIKKIFEPFSRAIDSTVNKTQGTGLGMSITKNIVDLMGGSINVTSEVGKGSVFEVVIGFRIAESEILNKKKGDNTEEFSLAGMNILAAEDNELNAEILTELLRLEGATVDIAENGKIAVEKLEKAESRTYDFILMDIKMPIMDGYQATKAIRTSDIESVRTTPIIAMTANAFAEDVQISLQSGIDAHLAKPIDMKKLKTTVQKIKEDIVTP